jgi:EmrB/QacA subfamily drug resistance transporter
MSPETIYRRRWWTLGVLSLALLVIGVDNTILNVALPSLREDLDASGSQLQWIVDSYLLVFAGILLTAGSLGDRFGRRRALTAGLGVFGLGSVAAALSGTADQLTASRALMGLGAAFIMPSTLSILTNVFPARERARAIAIWAAASGIGVAIGPVSGGFLLEHFSWGSVFLVNIPFVLAALLAVRPLVPESRDPAAPRLDVLGAALSVGALTTLVWAIIEAPAHGWTSLPILGALAGAGLFAAAFTAHELRTPHPMLDVRLFRNRRFSGASGAIALVFFALMGAIFFLTQYLQSVLGYTPFEAGVRVIPVALALVVGAGLSTRLTARIGTKLVVAGGLTTLSGGLLLLSTAGADSGYGLVAGVLTLMGLGMGAAMAPATDSVMGALPLDKASVGSAMNDASRMVGGALGVAVLGSVLASGYRSELDVTGLSPAAAGAARDSLGGALHVAGGAGPLVDSAQSAFVSGMTTASLVAAAIALAGAVFALVVLPAREPEAEVEALELAPPPVEALAA